MSDAPAYRYVPPIPPAVPGAHFDVEPIADGAVRVRLKSQTGPGGSMVLVLPAAERAKLKEVL